MSDKKPEHNYNVQHDHTLKFDSVFGELDFYKKKCEVLEKDLFKSQTQNKKSDLSIKKLQDMLSLYGKNTNNTSNSFLLPSEFKSNWESLVKDLVLEAFENVFENNQILTHLVQDTFKLVYEEALNTIRDKIRTVMKSLNINIIESNIDKFFAKFRLLFQENFAVIFSCTHDFIIRIKESLLRIVSENYSKDMLQGVEANVKNDVESKGFKLLVQSIFKLTVYMHLHDPQLSIDIQIYKKRELTYYFYNKADFINIEGFAKDQSPCLVILPPPLIRKNCPYQGIKPAVYIEPNPNELIRQQCEKNTPCKIVRSYSSSDCVNKENNEDKSSSTSNIPNAEMKNKKMNSGIQIINNSNSFKNSPKSKPSMSNSSLKPSPSEQVNNNPDKNIPIASSSPILNINKKADLPSKEYSPIPSKDEDKSQTFIKFRTFTHDQPTSLAKINALPSQDLQDADTKDKETSLIEGLKQCRSNSHNNIKNANASRNSSLLESFNNSLNKDSVRTNENFANQKTSRTNRSNTPIEADLDTGRKTDYILNEKLNGISNSFTLIRNKAMHNTPVNPIGVTNYNNSGKGFYTASKENAGGNENKIRFNLSSNIKKYNLNATGGAGTSANANANPVGNNKEAEGNMYGNNNNIVNNIPINKSKTNLFNNSNAHSNKAIIESNKHQEYTNYNVGKNNYQNFNRNNSHSSEMRVEQNQNVSNNINNINNNNIANLNSKENKTKASITKVVNIPAGASPSIASQNSNLNTNSNFNLYQNLKTLTEYKKESTHPFSNSFKESSKPSSKQNSHLEYLSKETATKNTTQVMFNGNYEGLNLNLNSNPNINMMPTQRHTTPTHKSTNSNQNNRLVPNTCPISTDENLNFFNTKGVLVTDYSDLGSSSNRLNTQSDYEYNNSLINDMKYNGPKKDEFSKKISSGKLREDGSKMSNVQFNFSKNSQSREDFSINNLQNVIYNAYTNANFGNFSQKSTDVKSKIDKFYQKLVTGNVIGKEQEKNNFNDTPNMNNRSGKEKIMKSHELLHKTQKTNFNVTNALKVKK